MERKLIHYLPYVVREIAEFKGITTGEQPEFELAWERVAELLDNQFVYTAGNYGLPRWEKMLEIVPKATDTLEERRFRILARLGEMLPYTITWLRRTLQNLCGQDGFTVSIEDGSYFLLVEVIDANRKKSEYVMEMLERVVPANIVFQVLHLLPPIYPKEPARIHLGGTLSNVIRLTIPEAADDYDFRHTLQTGGQTTVAVSFPVHEAADDINFKGRLNTGGQTTVNAALTITEAPDSHVFSGTLQTGGILSDSFVKLPVSEGME